MRIPIIRGIIDRRILVNFHVDPDVLSRILPRPFRPKVVNDYGIGGVCLIRVTQMRPRFLPSILGITSENAAHRIAVQWDTDEGLREGVYIPRRDTSSRLTTLVGGRFFPGVQHHAQFDVIESAGSYHVAVDSDDGQVHLVVDGRLARDLPSHSVFHSIREASDFFEAGALGYSATQTPDAFDGLELRTMSWSVKPLEIENVESSFFDNTEDFPVGSVGFDCALLMQEIEHEWHEQPSLCCSASPA